MEWNDLTADVALRDGFGCCMWPGTCWFMELMEFSLKKQLEHHFTSPSMFCYKVPVNGKFFQIHVRTEYFLPPWFTMIVCFSWGIAFRCLNRSLLGWLDWPSFDLLTEESVDVFQGIEYWAFKIIEKQHIDPKITEHFTLGDAFFQGKLRQVLSFLGKTSLKKR